MLNTMDRFRFGEKSTVSCSGTGKLQKGGRNCVPTICYTESCQILQRCGWRDRSLLCHLCTTLIHGQPCSACAHCLYVLRTLHMAGTQEMLSKIRSRHEYSRISTQVILLSGGISRVQWTYFKSNCISWKMIRKGFTDKIMFDIGLGETLGKVISVVWTTSTARGRMDLGVFQFIKAQETYQAVTLVLAKSYNLHSSAEHISRSLLLSKFKNTAIANCFPPENNFFW